MVRQPGGEKHHWRLPAVSEILFAMQQRISGGCRCGAVRYTVTATDLPRTYACHCRDCQTWPGGAFSQQALLPEQSLQVTGPIAVFELATADRISRQRFCAHCHTRIFNINTARPGLDVLRAGTLDASDALYVGAHIWVSRKQPWIQIPADVPSWPEGAPAAAFAAAMGLGT
ncbi:MAG: GFA family protein [Caulobacterales bacterium]